MTDGSPDPVGQAAPAAPAGPRPAPPDSDPLDVIANVFADLTSDQWETLAVVVDTFRGHNRRHRHLALVAS